MSINEASFQPTGLTPTQQRDATAAIYGFSSGLNLDANAPLSPEQAEWLRSLLARYDHDHSHMQEFDLNKPPQPRYVYREFPRMLYHHERRTMETVGNQAQLDYYLANGWSKEPFSLEMQPAAPALSEADQREAAFVDAELKRKRTK
jgi:hypothetical protein